MLKRQKIMTANQRQRSSRLTRKMSKYGVKPHVFVTNTALFLSPHSPGSCLKPKYNIVDSVFLNATWEAPADIAGKYAYTIDCRDNEGQYDVAQDVFPKASSANVILALRKFGSSFNCSVWAFIDSNITGRVNGKKTFFEVATQNLGPVSNLTYEIVNNIFLNAKWDAPDDNVTVDGYTIKCGDTDGSYNVTRDVIPKETSAHVTLPLRKFASTFNCSVWAFLIYNLNERVNGRKTVFEVTTPNLEPPEDVTVVLQCQNNAKVTWNYKPGVKLTGFVVELCWMNKSLCTNKTLPGAAREVEYSLLEYNALYTISVLAYVNDSIQTIYSSPTTATFFSFPKLPVLDDLSVSALNTTALSATWKEKWAYEIEFHLCTTPYDCQTYLVPGTLLQHTFSGLQPNTQYNVSAQAEFILYNRTCKGTQQSRTACTLAQGEVLPRTRFIML
ncbi:hypothetical protein HPB48_005703 [Haemaphysalis longicornis]|uniref:Fibronectin type-III domain-containing protein n=1 Tax=Haemaphysalis longicornis TaxID=44386 RepID=A0A9J6GYV2_HAELO|nr:hypothetical protein HPB48_005703 [Haemaphysalis longicornis]